MIKKEVMKLVDPLPKVGTSIQEIEKKKKRYSDAVFNEEETVIIGKPLKEENEESNQRSSCSSV